MNPRPAGVAGRWAIGDIVDLDRYPIDRPATDAYAQVLDDVRASLRADGCAVLADLVRPDALRAMSAEAEAIKPATHYSTTKINAYFGTEPDPSLPDHHPGNVFIERSSGFTPGDAFPEHSPIDALYRWPELHTFLAAALEVPALYCYADPLACLTINVLDPGQQFSWHYDNNDFAVTVLLDQADDGGLFRYAPNIRSRADENAEAAAAVMLGDDTLVKTLELHPGDMQIFRGRYSLHEVTRVGPESAPRHTAVFAYTLEEGLIGGLVRTEQLFGRTLPVHHEYAAGQAVREDVLLD